MTRKFVALAVIGAFVVGNGCGPDSSGGVDDAGQSGSGGSGGTAGAVGNGTAGFGGGNSAGSAGAAASAGAGGNSGSAGADASAGAGGSAGVGGSGGAGGSTGGTGGAAGTGGSGGMAGAAGTPGSGGTGGAMQCSACEPGYKYCSTTCKYADDPHVGCANSPTCTPCNIPHARVACVGGACALAACDPGWADCDNDPSNGCEADLTLPAHCTSCGTTCAAGQFCSSTGCVDNCTPPQTPCSATGSCVNLFSSPTHCGDCARACSGASIDKVPTCTSGVCGTSVSCGPGMDACGGICVPSGMCGSICSPGCTSGTQCISGQCACGPGWVSNPASNPALTGNGNCVMPDRDAWYCGSSLASCAGWCDAGACQTMPAPFVTGVSPNNSLAYAQGALYYVQTGAGTVNEASTASGTLTTIATGQQNPLGLAVDDTNVYWTNNLGGAVMQAPLGGGTPTVVASAQQPMLVAVSGTFVAWTERFNAPSLQWSSDAIGIAPKSGGPLKVYDVPDPTATGLGILNIAVDNNYVYYIIGNYSSAFILRMSTYDGSVTQLLNEPGIGANAQIPYFLLVTGGQLYYSALGTNGSESLHAMLADGSAPSRLIDYVQNQSWSPGPLLATDGQSIYWGFVRVPPCGGGVVNLAVPEFNGRPAVDDTYLYFFSHTGPGIFRIAK